MSQPMTPADSVLKSRRRRKPVFVDEPLQWHLRTTEHDRCLWCGLQEIERQGARKRLCRNEACESIFEIDVSSRDWFECKTLLDESVDTSRRTPRPWVSRSEEPWNHIDEKAASVGLVFTLKEAQIRSDTGRGFTYFMSGYDARIVFWHRQGYLPERWDARPACAGGSDFWRAILALRKEKVWTPDAPLNEMEVIAKAYGTDEPMFAIMDK